MQTVRDVSFSGSGENRTTKYISSIFEANFFIDGALKSPILLAPRSLTRTHQKMR